MKSIRSVCLKAAAVSLAFAALGTATVAQARSDVFFSIGAQVAPGVNVGVSNVPVYYPPQPVYVQPAPVYYQPAPVYYQPAPVYYRPAPVFGVVYERPGWHHGHGHWRHDHR